MATINLRAREIHAKIVYYGPGLSGKTSNLVNIHQRMPEVTRTEMRSIATEEERTLFFDFVPVEPILIGGWDVRFHLYSVPGQEHYVRTRRAILGGADGVVFVADADRDRLEANIASVDELATHLDHYGHTIEDLPLVFQYNKMDLLAAMPAAELNTALNPGGLPAFDAIAPRGNGVAETLRAISRSVAQRL
ncbi:MAG TPA: ADP-ribosylation factor-like protein [Thermomicrobiales bacterium]|nr:ADP-ribosylation factor-like protein [Thermomicrobiales bacterium]